MVVNRRFVCSINADAFVLIKEIYAVTAHTAASGGDISHEYAV